MSSLRTSQIYKSRQVTRTNDNMVEKNKTPACRKSSRHMPYALPHYALLPYTFNYATHSLMQFKPLLSLRMPMGRTLMSLSRPPEMTSSVVMPNAVAVT